MVNLYRILNAISVNLIRFNKISEFQAIRLIHSSIRDHVKTKIHVNEYLLNRSVPASQILSNLTLDDASNLEKIKTNYQYLLSKGLRVPKVISDKDYLELLCLSYRQQIKYFEFLAKREFSRENEVVKKLSKNSLIVHDDTEDTDYVMTNRVYSKYINKTSKALTNNRLYQSFVLKSQEVVFDFSFENNMYRREVKNLSKQIMYCYSHNKDLEDPFQMYFVNLKPGTLTYSDLNDTFLPVQTSWLKSLKDFPIVVSEQHYLDLFPNKRLVYLSPDSTHYFHEGEYDHSAVYIIGSLVEKGEKLPLTLSRARKENIEHRAFPIDRYVDWKSGTKDLTLDQAFKILMLARESNGDWNRAITDSIPTRSTIENKTRYPKLNRFIRNDE